jgi:hypothetical protein
MAEHFLGGQGLGKSAVFKSLATPANPGADADLAGGSDGLMRDQLAANRSQPAKSDITQSVAQKLAAASAGIWRTSLHGSAISMSFRHPVETG